MCTGTCALAAAIEKIKIYKGDELFQLFLEIRARTLGLIQLWRERAREILAARVLENIAASHLYPPLNLPHLVSRGKLASLVFLSSPPLFVCVG